MPPSLHRQMARRRTDWITLVGPVHKLHGARGAGLAASGTVSVLGAICGVTPSFLRGDGFLVLSVPTLLFSVTVNCLL